MDLTYDEPYFFFFDNLSKDLIGCVSINKNFKGKWLDKINSSGIKKNLIGQGYGFKMYLTIISICEYLRSDEILYKGSFNLWANVLPKYVNVWYKMNKKYHKVKENKPFDKSPADVDYFVASIFHKKI